MCLALLCASSATIVALYYIWRHTDAMRRQQLDTVRERVAYLLWTAATAPDDTPGTLRKV